MSLNFGNTLFPQRKEKIISFDFIDLLAKQGLVTFYPGTKYNDSATETKVLERNVFDTISQSFTNSTSTKNASFTKIIDHDYDFEIGTNLIINGKGSSFISFSCTSTNDSGVSDDANTTTQIYFIVKLRKYSGTTETEIANGKTQTIEAVESSTNISTTTTGKSTLLLDCTRTNINKGDILRVTIEGWLALPSKRLTNTNSKGSLIYYIDPLERLKEAINYGEPTTEEGVYEYAQSKALKIDVPFEINF